MRGGKRQGAGRKKGSPNKATAAREAAIAATGVTPLDLMLSIMRDETQPQAVRLEMAKAAAPYVHPRFAAIEHRGEKDAQPQYKIIAEIVGSDRKPCISEASRSRFGTRVSSSNPTGQTTSPFLTRM